MVLGGIALFMGALGLVISVGTLPLAWLTGRMDIRTTSNNYIVLACITIIAFLISIILRRSLPELADTTLRSLGLASFMVVAITGSHTVKQGFRVSVAELTILIVSIFVIAGVGFVYRSTRGRRFRKYLLKGVA